VVNYQWGIFWADLNPTKGSEQSGTRPVLVISSEEVNEVLPIVTVLSITSMKTGRKVYSIEVLLKSKDTGLSIDSIAMAHQIRAISKERLGNQCGIIESETVKESIRNAMKTYLELE
jgi:mRNA interferase MazF